MEKSKRFLPPRRALRDATFSKHFVINEQSLSVIEALREAVDAANVFAEDVLNSKKAGLNEHIAKPIDIDELARVLAAYVK